MTKTAKEIARAMRCTATAEDEARDCASCPYWKKETLTPAQQEMFGVEEWGSCDVERICLDAAARLERMVEIEESIESLRAESERFKKANAAVARRWLRRRWRNEPAHPG